MRTTLSVLALAASLALGANAAIAADDTVSQKNKTAAPVTGQVEFANPFDPSAWHDAGAHAKPGHKVKVNPADPEFWVRFAGPKTHTGMHMAFTNPVTYGQMMNPGFYMQMMKPATWVKWMNPASYATMMDPATMAHWMQPGAYMHAMNPAGYMQAMNPEAYAKMMAEAKPETWMNPSSYTPDSSGSGADAATNVFNPMAWMSMFAPAANGPKS
ncbi:MAG: hypothetical protein AAF441_11175 [Pseudomonadota bacterium]